MTQRWHRIEWAAMVAFSTGLAVMLPALGLSLLLVLAVVCVAGEMLR